MIILKKWILFFWNICYIAFKWIMFAGKRCVITLNWEFGVSPKLYPQLYVLVSRILPLSFRMGRLFEMLSTSQETYLFLNVTNLFGNKENVRHNFLWIYFLILFCDLLPSILMDGFLIFFKSERNIHYTFFGGEQN